MLTLEAFETETLAALVPLGSARRTNFAGRPG